MSKVTDWSVIDNQDTVYHYTKICKAVEDILFYGRLRFSTGANTNDPREYRNWDLEPYIDGDCPHEEYRLSWLEAEKSFKKCKDHYKYACFCLSDPPDRGQTRLPGYARLRMWAQYGDNFSGVCIAFSAESLKERLNGKSIFYDWPVHYHTDLENIDTALQDANANEFIDKSKDEWATGYIRDHLDQIFFSKHEDYRDEREYRIVIYDPEERFEYIDVSGCIKAVLLGDRTKDVYREIVKEFCENINADCKQVVWQRGRLHLIDI